ncbi:MAG: histidinol dehydrogenase [Gammaproteobacteria bacterium]|nr:histidinol dehydrogenase [Gammaproteobacteria bacterium]
MEYLEWNSLDEQGKGLALARPPQARSQSLLEQVAGIIERVKSGGDKALLELTREIDAVQLESLRVSDEEFRRAEAMVSLAQKAALRQATENIRKFHQQQMPAALRIETAPGVICEQVIRPITAVGLYVPAGTAPLPSAVLMLAIPAAVAGCARRAIFTPPGPDGYANSAVLVAASLCGVNEVYKLGGAQAIAAMAYGTESIARVDKIFGPGNTWVTAAKMAVSIDPAACICDMPAGPSEVMVVADAGADARCVAADLLSQAEHGPDSQVLLVSTDRSLAEAVQREIEAQLQELPRRAIAGKALDGSRILLVEDLTCAMEVVNAYAPEHLILQVQQAREWLPAVHNAGSVFLGPWTPESVGDYCSGTNHVLPTYGYARAVSGLSVVDFLRRMSVQELTPEGLQNIGPVAEVLAEMEGLLGHARAVSLRLARLPGSAPV